VSLESREGEVLEERADARAFFPYPSRRRLTLLPYPTPLPAPTMIRIRVDDWRLD
jgi:hypothetical protein